MEVVQNGGKSFKTHFISVNVQSLIWRTDAVYYRCKIKGINGERRWCEQIIVHCTFVFNQIEATANNITGTGWNNAIRVLTILPPHFISL